MTTHVEPIRVGVVLLDLPDRGVPALKYLITRMNSEQTSIEFELLPQPWAPEDTVPDWSSSRVGLNRSIVRDQLPLGNDAMVSLLRAKALGYGLLDSREPDHFVFVSLASFEDGYFTCRSGSCSYLAMGSWERDMAPPTLVEFILTLLVREAAAAANSELRSSIHLGTRGCVFDFDPDLEDVRFKVLNGFVCHACRLRVEATPRPNLATDLASLAARPWIGSIADQGSPAHIAAALGHNLFVSKALTPTAWEVGKAKLQEEWMKTLLAMFASVVGATLILILSLKH
jgi:hypothetical protein